MTTFLLGLLLAGCAPAEADISPPPTEAAADTDWSAELSALDRRIAAHRARAVERESWLEAGEAAELLRQRARLSGSLDDYAEAEALYTTAFDQAPEGSGPWLGLARLHSSLHRLPQAEAALDEIDQRTVQTAATRRGAADLRADIALEQGRLAEAEAHWRSAEAERPSLQTAAGLARIAWARGAFAEADAWLQAGLERHRGPARAPAAWVSLQRGLIALDQGQPAEALAHYTDAAAALPGYWLVDEHIAEALAELGEVEEAIARYRDVVARTERPELQAALATLLLSRGEVAEATLLLDAAEATYAVQLARFPEAASGHALDHALLFGDDAPAALALAEQNAALRPSGEALARLSTARLAAGDVAGAQQAAARGLLTGTRSASLFVAAAQSAQAAGDPEAAASHLASAAAINPQTLPEEP